MEHQTNKITNEQLDKLAINNNLPMNSLGILIPYSYFSKRVNLNWYDILFAIENGYLSYRSAIEHAMSNLEIDETYSQDVLDLACLLPDDAANHYLIRQYLDELATQVCDELKNETRSKVLYILLNWVFEHKENYADPLRVVEFIYDDFNFPKSIEKIVRYKPAEEPLLDTIQANIERLYNNWSSFLDMQREKWGIVNIVDTKK